MCDGSSDFIGKVGVFKSYFSYYLKLITSILVDIDYSNWFWYLGFDGEITLPA